MQHGPVPQSTRCVAVWGRKQGSDFLFGEIIDQLGVRPLGRHGSDHHRLLEADRMAMFDETEKRFDCCQSGVARPDGIGAPLLDMFKERSDRLNVEVLDGKFRRGSLALPGGKPQQEAERTGIGRDGMSACPTFVGKMGLQEG